MSLAFFLRYIGTKQHELEIARVLFLAVLVGVASAGSLPGQSAGVAETYREAYDSGFSDGRSAGRQDRESGNPSSFSDSEAYERADNGYLPERHDYNVYRVAYRRGFEDGYRAGFDAGGQNPSKLPVQDSQASPAPQVASGRDTPVNSGRPRIPAGTTVVVELLQTLSTKYNERGDEFAARVTQDVQLQGMTVIPRGSKVTGTVSYLKRAGRIRGRAQISLHFEQLRFPDGRQYAIEASLVDLEAGSEERVGESEGTVVAPSSKKADAGKVGKASGIGALVGVISGGKRGAGVGAAAGAVAGLATVLITRGRDAQLEARTQLTIQLTEDLTLSRASP